VIKKEAKNVARVRRHERVRTKISGTAERPRLVYSEVIKI